MEANRNSTVEKRSFGEGTRYGDSQEPVSAWHSIRLKRDRSNSFFLKSSDNLLLAQWLQIDEYKRLGYDRITSGTHVKIRVTPFIHILRRT